MDDGPWGDLVKVLDAQADLCAKLIDLGQDKTNALVEGDLKKLDQIVSCEQAVIAKAAVLESARQRSEAQIRDLVGDASETVSLLRLIELSPEPYNSKLTDGRQRLISNIKWIGRINEVNSKLMKQYLRYVNFLLNQISLEKGGTYGPDGNSNYPPAPIDEHDVKV